MGRAREAELEELPATVVPRRRGRIGWTSALAIAALSILLASGLGFLGGRTSPQTASSAVTPASAHGASAEPAATEQHTVPPFDRPTPVLRIIETGDLLAVVEGCDVVLTLRTGDEIRSGCDRDLSLPAPPPTQVRADAPLSFDVDGWSVTDLEVICGSQFERVFSTMPEPGCEEAADGTTFVAPRPGDWTLALAACATSVFPFQGDRVCGTWFASVTTE